MILRAFFARSPDASTVSFRYYLLGGDTAALSGLFARLCHKFLVTFFLTDFSGTILTFFSPDESTMGADDRSGSHPIGF